MSVASQRLTVFSVAPDSEVLGSVVNAPCRLFRSQSTGAHFLEPTDKYNATHPSLGGYYDSIFKFEGPFDLAGLKAFENANAEHRKWFHIHDECVREAIFASRVFQTVVLSSYSDDEADDFVAIAKNGELTHVRFAGYREVVRTLSAEDAAATETEISAVRLDLPGRIVKDKPTCEYHAYEARMSPDAQLQWYPYWRYIEGELNANAIFKTLSQDPPDVPGNLMFRIANLEFRALFGRFIPDPYDDKDDYVLVDEYFPPQRSASKRMSRTTRKSTTGSARKSTNSFVGLIKNYRNYLLILAALVGVSIFRSLLQPGEEDWRQFKFADHCSRFSGQLEMRNDYSGLTGKNQCRVGERVYLEHELPGDAGEVRRIAGTLENKPCDDGEESTCLFFNGVKFDWPIEDADIAAGDRVITALKRTQVCDYKEPGVCDDGRPVFSFQAGTMFSAPANE